MKKSEMKKILKSNWIEFEIFWNKKDKTKTSYELKLVKDKNTNLRTNIDYNCSLEDFNQMIEAFKKFDYREYMKSILHN